MSANTWKSHTNKLLLSLPLAVVTLWGAYSAGQKAHISDIKAAKNETMTMCSSGVAMCEKTVAYERQRNTELYKALEKAHLLVQETRVAIDAIQISGACNVKNK